MSLPWYARLAVRLTYPSAERDEVCADLGAELRNRRAATGALGAHVWLIREIATSTPSLVRRGIWRGSTGFESQANAMRPGGAPMEGVILDARFTLRRLRSRPLYAALAVLTLALGVGGASAIYGIARTFLVDALPYADESKLVMFAHDGDWTEQEFLYLRGKAPGFSGLTMYRPSDATLMLDNSPAQLVHDAVVSSELFSVLGVKPFLGRTFSAGDDALNSPAIDVVSYDFWRELGGDASVVGRRILTDGTPRTIVGVMPRDFWFPDPTTRMWVPGPFDPASRVGNYAIIGRLAPNVPSADAALSQVSAFLKERFTGDFRPSRLAEPLSAKPLRDFLFGPLRPALIATLLAIAGIMLIACANVAALMLGQIEGRTVELSVRAALGADRTRISQQIVLESLAIGSLAALAGAVIATLTFRVLVASLPLGALAGRVTLDYTLFAAASGIALIAAIAITVIPVAALWRGGIRDSIGGVRTSGIGGGSRMAGALVAGEVAMALLMTAGAGVIARSVSRLYDIEPGMSRNGVAVVDIVTPASLDLISRQQIVQALMREVGAIPGVKSVSMTQRLPLRPGWTTSTVIPSHPEIKPKPSGVRMVAPDYFETMGIRLVRGRGITGQDVAGREAAIVINQKLADLYFRDEDPLGKTIGTGFGAIGRIVGIVENVAEGQLTDTARAVRYMAYLQVPFMVPPQTLVIRTIDRDAGRQLAPIQSTIRRTAPTVAIQAATTLSREIDRAVGPARQVMFLLGLLTSLALTLGAIGIYGVIAQFVTRRSREWAVRMALGLSPARVIQHVVRRGTILVGTGVGIGLAGTLMLPKLVRPFLYGVSAGDPTAMLMAVGILVVVGISASMIPALRAARVDPAMTLREQ